MQLFNKQQVKISRTQFSFVVVKCYKLSFVVSSFTGEAVYCDDMPIMENEVYLCLLRSTRTHAKLISIDPQESLKIEGVIGFFSAANIPADQNKCGVIVADEEVFASEKVAVL